MNINRIFCIGKNYAEHVAELAHLGHTADAGDRLASAQTVSEPASRAEPAPASLRGGPVAPPDSSCVVFMKPPSCIVPAGEPIVLPRDRGPVHHEAELVVLLTGGGADIPREHALETVAAITLGLDLTLRDLQTQLKNAGNPWELAKAFDGAAPLGEWTAYTNQDLQALEFTFHVNGQLRQHGRTGDMLFPVARQIHILSKTWSLEPGDIIYTGTPAGVGPLLPGDRVALASEAIGRFEWHCR